MQINVHAIILARGGSKGIKFKNLVSVNSKPLIYWSLRSAKTSKLINHVWVSSDCNKILSYSKKYRVNIIKRPKKFSQDHSSSESAWLHAISCIEKKYKIDLIVGIQPTSPIRGKDDFDQAIVKFKKYKLDSLFSSVKIHDYCAWRDKGGKLDAYYNFRKRKRRQKIEIKYLENGSFYIFDKSKFIKYRNRLFGKIGTYVMKKKCGYQLDDSEDLLILNSIMKGCK